MPWFVWLVFAAAFGLVIGSLMMLRDSRMPPPTEEQLARMRERNQQLDQEDRKDH